MRVVWLFIAAACLGAGCDGVFGLTRVHGDDDVDAPITQDACATVTGHDEDGDGLDDGCDPCPFSTDNSNDGDGDGIALACDPDPSRINSVLLFEGFGPATNAKLARATIIADAMHASKDATNFSLFMWGENVDKVWVVAGVRVSGGNTSASYREIGMAFDVEADVSGEVYGTMCVLGKGSTEYVQAYASPQNSGDIVLMTQPSGLTVDTFAGTMRGYYDRSGSPQVGCTFSNGMKSPSIMGTRTPLPQPGQLVLYVDDLDADIDYVFVTTRP